MSPDTDPLDGDEARRALYDVMRQDHPFDEKAERALDIGVAYLDVDNGHVTRIDQATNHWKAIASTDPPDGAFPPGLSLDLETTYCRRTASAESAIALHDAPAQGWEDDPAFETHGLHCYHGTTLTVDDDVYGTVCFVAESAREDPFTPEETMFADLVGHLLARAIEHSKHETAVRRREQLIAVLDRVLRHNLRNDLTLISGHAELLDERLDPTAPELEDIQTASGRLLDLTAKARKLNRVLRSEFEWQTVTFDAFVQRVVDDVDAQYPRATISQERHATPAVQVIPPMERAIRELVENAAKHGGEAPEVTVSVRTTEDTVRCEVADDGPGVPAQERTVLEEGAETPLTHGSGLGLWLVHWVVQAHDGHVAVDVSGQGTTMTVSIPHVVTGDLAPETVASTAHDSSAGTGL